MTFPVNSPTILLIEDNAQDIELIVDGLAPVVPRERVEICRDGAVALDFLHCRGSYSGRHPEDLPMFALLDLELPRVSGFDVLRAIRAEPSARLLPVTVLSASDRVEDVREAARLGANSFVRKPRAGGHLADMLEQLARYWLELNIPPPHGAGQ